MLDSRPLQQKAGDPSAVSSDFKRVVVIQIKPTQYDEDKFPHLYKRAIMPSNSLAAMHSLTRKTLTESVPDGMDYEVHTLQDNAIGHYRKLQKLKKRFPEKETKLIVCLVAVQTAEFNRARDLMRDWQAVGATCVIGGFHVSGLIATLLDGVYDTNRPTIPKPKVMPEELRQLMDEGIILFKGEAENLWSKALRDIIDGSPKPLYRGDNPELLSAPIPQYPEGYFDNCVLTNTQTVDTSRGCPFVCSFCSIINVHGRTSRPRDPRCIISRVKQLCEENGRVHFFFTDDNFARSPKWEELLDGLAELRNQGYDFKFMIQVDLVCDTIPNFIEKLAAAGCTQVFMGVESMNPESLAQAGKGQNKVKRYQALWDKCHQHDILVHAGYIIGFDPDTPESVRRDVDLLHSYGVDFASFFILSPAPGSEDHVRAFSAGKWMNPDWDLYDTFHPVVHHPTMSRQEWLQAYVGAWQEFYSTSNMLKALKRHKSRAARRELFRNYFWYRWCAFTEQTHPMIAGVYRFRFLNDRRRDAPKLSAWKFLGNELKRHFRYARNLLVEFYRFQHLAFEADLVPSVSEQREMVTDKVKSAGDWLRLTFSKRPNRRWLNQFWLDYGAHKWDLLWHPRAILKHAAVPFIVMSEVIYTVRFLSMLPQLALVNAN